MSITADGWHRTLCPKIEYIIARLEQKFQEVKGLILTEDDIKCLLYSKLLKIPELCKNKNTDDDSILSIALHTEISWYDKKGKLTIKPDISIMEPENLRILRGFGNKMKLPSKGFEFKGKAIIFELKFVRFKTGITRGGFEKTLEKDFKKIQKLFEKLDEQRASNDVFCYFVIFNKTNKKCKEFDSFLRDNGQSHRHKIIYATGDVIFPRRARKSTHKQ